MRPKSFYSGLIVPALLGCLTATAHSEPVDLLDMPAHALRSIETSLLLDMAQSQQGWAAVGERGLIVHSDGTQWVQSAVPVSVTLTALAFNGEGTGLAVGHDGAILRSEDAGRNWQKVTDGRVLFPKVIAAAEERFKQDEAKLATATDAEREDLEWALDESAFRLETAQQSMEFGPSWPLLDVVFSGTNEAWAIGAYGIAFQSRDGGKSWTLASKRLGNFEDLHLNAAIKTRAGSFIVAGESGMILRSTDGGTSFDRYDSDSGLSLFGIAEAEDFLVAFGFGDSILISTDDGASWQPHRLQQGNVLIGAVTLEPGKIGLLGASGVMLEVTADGPGAVTRPTGERGFLSAGGWLTEQQLTLVGEAGFSALTGAVQ